MTKKSVGIIYKHNYERARREAEDLQDFLTGRGVRVVSEEMDSGETGQGCPEEHSGIPSDVDYVVVLGGDGTLLGAARKVGKYGAPILGVNIGGLGFLTEIPLKRLYHVIEMMLKGELETESRLMLETEVLRDGEEICRFRVLNDVVINKGPLARIIDLDVYINDLFLTTYRADGLIVSTPTGSTAYNLSAGGPILYPTLDNVIVTPICPFALTIRSIILPDTDTISIGMGKMSEEKVSLTFDGQVGFDFYHGDRVFIHKSEERIRLFKSPDQSYFEILRTKLMWGGAPLNQSRGDH
ncbi:MAG: NAD(+)/NADH kinase [Deltaproteobacteria bacterium]|nr:NAD(+)/NADH kinase [Deltaproteobacteria bacterium]MBW2136102.1 NAD(+)/NADH kinase [Deltaproteobacteria bacterium]